MNTAQYLKMLDAPYGVSGNEKEIRECVKDLFKKFADDVYTDVMGNVVAVKKGTSPDAKKIMIEAHMDELGLMVNSVTDDGSITFIPIGGFDPKVLTGTEVTVWGKEKLFGIIGATPPHLKKESDKVPQIDELCVDVGMTGEKVREIVSVGDIITINTSYTELGENALAARAVDDRGGLAIIMKTLELISKFPLENDVIAVATVQEEVGLRGAKTAATSIMPDCAIAIDVCHAKSPGVSDEAYPLGKGPVITIGPNLHSKMTKEIIRIANENDIPFQLEVCSGNTGTDAWEIQVAGFGIPTALMSVPIRYMHANYEVCNTKDMENASLIIAHFLVSFNKGEFLCW